MLDGFSFLCDIGKHSEMYQDKVEMLSVCKLASYVWLW